MKHLRSILMGLLALPLAAGNPGFSAGGGVILGLDSYKKAVNSTTGFMINAGWETTLAKTDVPVRVALNLGTMPGKALNGLKTSLTLAQLSGDLLLDTGVPRLRGVFGLSLNSYKASFSGDESPAIFDAEHHFPFHDCKGLKGGLRAGLEYALTSRVTVEALLQATELAGRQRNDALIRQGAINPAWLQLGARYQF
ncbi:hypothetical protein [Mesoterricola silvestris]|uniref:Outer membrane protein beta-barrel domain-containing protein n=1 Tax=Mesoterricola silvestris TaxID=2927979 RepID=A0AA48GLW3_9BACT|nr:hypothetical protein [Mesoterricola silvestris]BDU71875.1 hypothetical protein METEAL_10490 [Mesoterricola silvestris]